MYFPAQMIYGDHMAEDDIEKLLREINASSNPASGSSEVSSKRSDIGKKAHNKKSDSPAGSGRFPFAVASGVVIGGAGAVIGLFFPFFTIIGTGLTAAVAAFVTAIIAGPPKWFSS
jgi:hypothetical protein